MENQRMGIFVLKAGLQKKHTKFQSYDESSKFVNVENVEIF
jgi:hypothetical protein